MLDFLMNRLATTTFLNADGQMDTFVNPAGVERSGKVKNNFSYAPVASASIR